MARDGIDVTLVETQGAVDNLHMLIDKPDAVDVALVQGGLTGELPDNDNAKHVVAIAGLFYEPAWVLLRPGLHIRHVSELRHRRIAIGLEGSGTRALAEQLLAANNLGAADVTTLKIGNDAALEALDKGDIDAAVFVAGAPSPRMTDLLTRRRAFIMSFDQADAYLMKFPFLTSVPLPIGAVSLAADVPPTRMTLVAPTAMLLARDDIHPALVTLLLRAASRMESGRQLFAPAGTFPTLQNLDFPVQSDAQRYFDRGPSILYRFLPFSIAVWIQRMVVLVVPLLTMLPIVRLAPPAYRWQMQRKIYQWYKHLRRIEAAVEDATTPEQCEKLRHELVEIEARLQKLRLPISYVQQLYDLRGHVDFVRDRLTAKSA
ncbi:MAG TPA: TAXI family TRAP transporter solute-binding subunit [Methylomirabilota bacterium]|nr:TAXI family TRAP transporter solute-binding subunit [Methylomirabilota bacterium]